MLNYERIGAFKHTKNEVNLILWHAEKLILKLEPCDCRGFSRVSLKKSVQQIVLLSYQCPSTLYSKYPLQGVISYCEIIQLNDSIT